MNSWPHKVSRLHRWQNSRAGQNAPKLTIITPSYNQGRFLEETILSVLNQDYPNLEYIVIDGGSSDNSVDVIRKYEDRLAYWVSEKDRGQTHAINKGLERATGDIVGWVNSDDMYLPWSFRKAVDAFKSRPDVDLLWGGRVLIGADSEVLGFGFPTNFDPSSMRYCINSETAFWRRRVHADVGIFDESLRFAMDLDFFGRVFRSKKVGYVDALQGCFRCYADNKSSTLQDVCAAETRLLWRKHFGMEFTPPHLAKRNWMTWLRVMVYPSIGLFPYLRNRVR